MMNFPVTVLCKMLLQLFTYVTIVDTKLGVVTDTPEDFVAIQRGLNRLEKQAQRDHVFSSTGANVKSCPQGEITPGISIC